MISDERFWLSDRGGFDSYIEDRPDEVIEDFNSMWLVELEDFTDNQEELMSTANAILKYFGLPLTTIDVAWDDPNLCFVWLMERLSR